MIGQKRAIFSTVPRVAALCITYSVETEERNMCGCLIL